MLRRVILAIFVALAFTACGKKGNPKPPDISAPSPVKNLTAAGQVDGVVLSWSAPETTVEDEELKDLGHFIIRRGLYAAGQQAEFEELATVELNRDPANSSYHFKDPEVEPGKTYVYAVVPVNLDDAEGAPGRTIRVRFLGEASTIEGL